MKLTIGQMLFGMLWTAAGMAILGVEARVALNVNQSPHWAHWAAVLFCFTVSFAILFPERAKTLFGWFGSLIRSARSGKE